MVMLLKTLGSTSPLASDIGSIKGKINIPFHFLFCLSDLTSRHIDAVWSDQLINL